MWLDIIFVLTILYSFYYGFRKGIIFMLFLFVGIVLGLFASLHLSYITASYISQWIQLSEAWMPTVSFVVSFLLVFWAARFIAGIIKGILKITFLNLFNKLIGGIMSALACFFCATIFIWYLIGLNMLPAHMAFGSMSYTVSFTFAPVFLETMSNLFPILNKLIASLQNMFEEFAIQNLQMNQ